MRKVIHVVHRIDKSGTTEIFTRALSSFSEDWRSTIGVTGLVAELSFAVSRAEGSFGMARTVKLEQYCHDIIHRMTF